MKIKSLEVSLFKGFQKSKLEFGQGLNLLVGANNSGKSSLIQALFLAFYFLKTTEGISGKDTKDIKKLKGIMLKSFPLALHDKSYLSEGLKIRSRRDKTTQIKITMDDGVEFMERLSFPGGNPLVISSNLDGEDGPPSYKKSILKITKDKQPLLIPSFAGVVNREEIKTKEVVDYYVSSGKSNEVLRNQIKGLSKKELEILNYYLKDSFNVVLSSNETHDIHLSSIYKDGKYNNLDISSAGSGFQQILQILVYIVTSDAKIILIDEPDAHLHYRLQNSLYNILTKLVEEGKQIIVATHSQIFIKNAIEKNDHLILVNKKQNKQKSINEYGDYLKSLYEDGLLDEEDITEEKEIKYIFLEDSNSGNGFKIIKLFLEKLNYKNPEFKIISCGGDSDSDLKFLKRSRDINKLKFKALFIRDSDSIPDTYLEKIKTTYNDKDISICFLDVHEVENYLLNPKLINKTIKQKYPTLKIKDEDIEKIINDVVAENRDKILDNLEGVLRGKLNDSYRLIDLLFTDIQTSTIQIRNDIRDKYYTFPYSKLPGKEIYRMVKEEIQKKYKINISELDIAINFDVSDIPDLIKESLKFFK
ncbi:hypothetical protein C0581_01675 [Candidatus Parcubacteria bacterium]|nr:MAG: hypothetical protein C0581_01675 [Candidatus Parcubacteria bacterium]